MTRTFIKDKVSGKFIYFLSCLLWLLRHNTVMDCVFFNIKHPKTLFLEVLPKCGYKDTVHQCL